MWSCRRRRHRPPINSVRPLLALFIHHTGMPLIDESLRSLLGSQKSLFRSVNEAIPFFVRAFVGASKFTRLGLEHYRRFTQAMFPEDAPHPFVAVMGAGLKLRGLRWVRHRTAPQKPGETPVAIGVGPDGHGLRLKAPDASRQKTAGTTGQKPAYRAASALTTGGCTTNLWILP
jgi:hypothetical protein